MNLITNLFFNFAGLIIIFIGLYFLNKRKREKDERKNNLKIGFIN